MDRKLAISEELYTRLESTSRMYGYDSIEQMLETWLLSQDESRLRQATVHRIDMLWEQMQTKYGEMPDSVDLIREDRAR
jgi:hypothetical protein